MSHARKLLDQAALFKLAKSEVPAGVLAHPGMLCEAERRALFGLTRCLWRPGSTIIDAGAFLGVSTRLFAEALRESEASAPSIYAYEFGIFNDFNAQVASNLLRRPFHSGENFAPLWRQLVDDRTGLVQYHVGDIREFPYSGGPIAVAFLDILKSVELMNSVYQMFFDSFDDNTILYQQDYFHPYHPWIAFSMARYSDHFLYIGRVEPDEAEFNGAIFGVRDSSLLSGLTYGSDPCSLDEVLDIMSRAVALHQHPLEKLHMVGLRAAAEACFIKDGAHCWRSFENQLRDLSLSRLLDDPRQMTTLGKIRHFVNLFANDPHRRWV